MKKILIITSGGTVGQRPNKKGVFKPSNKDYFHKIEGLDQLANITVVNLGNIDSTDMDTSAPKTALDRAKIAKTIFENASKYDGFVIVHGTDTLPETAAALTYMISNLGKPIVLTGSQRSIWSPRSDAQNNLFTAVQAATMDIGEVVVAFGNYLLRGTRVKKVHEEKYDAFETPGVHPLGQLTALSHGIMTGPDIIRRHNGTPKLFTEFDTGVFNYVHISGAYVDEPLEKIATSKQVSGILIGSFGAGNFPTRLNWFIEKASKNGKPIIVYTRCETGAADMGLYSVGAANIEAGAESAGDMTLEALGQKFMFALGLLKVAREGKLNKYAQFFPKKTSIPKLSKLARQNPSYFVTQIIKTSYNGDITVVGNRK